MSKFKKIFILIFVTSLTKNFDRVSNKRPKK